MKAITLLSGGLDSTLATKLIIEQGIEVEAINFYTVFCTSTLGDATCLVSKSAADMGIGVKVFDVSEEHLGVVKNPKYGYGRQMNPCIDCRIFMFKKAKEYMKKTGASFLVTGEVLGERPMSQRKEALRIIEKETDLEGLILRPLSAKLLPPTVPEKQGLVDRERFLAISGRSRKTQIQLAKQLGIMDYPWPAGGCLLTDPGFAKRMRDLIDYEPNFSLRDVQLLKVGRHFRLSPYAKLIVGRNQQENKKLLNLAEDEDIIFNPRNLKGPVAIGRGKYNPDLICLSGGIIARYCNGLNNQSVEIFYKKIHNDQGNNILSSSLLEEEIVRYRI